MDGSVRNKENAAAYQRKWRAANKDKAVAAEKKYRAANKDKAKEYRAVNKERREAYNKKWKAANGDKVLKANKRYYLKLNLANAKISRRTLSAWAAQVKERTPFCEWCYSEDNLEAHHILPKSKYPQFALDINNGRTMCENCHMNCHIQGGY